MLARELTLLNEQEREIVHNLSNVVTDMQRSYRVARTAYNRYRAAIENRTAVETRERLNKKADPTALLDAHRRELDAETQYFRKLVEYAVSIKNVHYEKGTLLEFNNVLLAENMTVPRSRDDQLPKPAEPAPPAADPAPGPDPALAPAGTSTRRSWRGFR